MFSIQHGETLTDEQGNVIQSVDAIKPPKGWNWSTKDGWKVDLNRAVDHDGKDKKMHIFTMMFLYFLPPPPQLHYT